MEYSPKAQTDQEKLLAMLGLLMPEEAARKCYKILYETDQGFFPGNNISVKPEEFDAVTASHYQGTRLQIAIEQLADRLKYMVKVFIFGGAEESGKSMGEIITDVRRILDGKLHLVDCMVTDPKEAKEVAGTVEVLRKLSEQEVLGRALAGDADKNNSGKN